MNKSTQNCLTIRDDFYSGEINESTGNLLINMNSHLEMYGIDISTIASYHSVITSRANSLMIER